MTKTKAQFRREAVERLKTLNHPSSSQIVDAITGDEWMHSQSRCNALIDLLTDDEPVNGKNDDSLQDSREDATANCKKPDYLQDRFKKLEALVRDMIVTLNSYSALLAINLDAENTEKCNAIVGEYNERMKKLGIEVDA